MARLLDFHAEWCGPCKQQAPIIDELNEEYDDLDVEKVDVDEKQDVASEYGVRSIPTVVIENDDGDPVERFVGLTDRDQLEEAIEGVL